MKVSTLVFTLATAGSMVAANPHRHRHRHVEKRSPEVKVVPVPGPTVVEYWIDNHKISEEEYKEGVKNHSFAPVDTTPKPGEVPAKPVQNKGAEFYEKPQSSPQTSPQSDTTDTKGSDTKGSDTKGSDTTGSDTTGSGAGSQGSDMDFPDGQLSCDEFPEKYGAVKVPWQGLGGWSGVQDCTASGDGKSITHINTAIQGGKCDEGNFCSYACGTGYLRAQWPASQGASGESVGGLQCKGGKLHLPEGSMSKKLCIPGVPGISVENKLGKSLPICKTDYPGTEKESIPATFDATASSYKLACPDGDNYYNWQGKSTSAQYYINPPGTSMEEGCTWGNKGSNKGNFAPVVIGCSKKGGQNWLGLSPNFPTNPNVDFKGVTIEITGDVSCKCKFVDGKFYQDGNEMPGGCTASGNGVYSIYTS